MSKAKKGSLLIIGVLILVIVALLVNPKDIYYQYKDKDNIVKMAKSAIEEVENKTDAKEIDVEYLGGNVYSVRTNNHEYLIKKTVDKESNIRYKFFYDANLVEK